MNGYAGRILRVNLSDGTINTEPTAPSRRSGRRET